MALVEYGFKCTNKGCKNYQKAFTDLLDRDGDHKSKCPLCGNPAQRVYSLAGFTFAFRAGFDVGLGRNVNSEAERQNILAEEGIRQIKC